MLGYHGLGLIQAFPKLGHAGVFSLFDQAQQPQAKRMAENLQFSRVAVNNGIVTAEFHRYIV